MSMTQFNMHRANTLRYFDLRLEHFLEVRWTEVEEDDRDALQYRLLVDVFRVESRARRALVQLAVLVVDQVEVHHPQTVSRQLAIDLHVEPLQQFLFVRGRNFEIRCGTGDGIGCLSSGLLVGAGYCQCDRLDAVDQVLR